MSAGFAQVALPLPLHAAYTYRIPDGLAARVVPGARVIVPLRARRLVGIVLAVGVEPPATPRDILDAPDDLPAITAPILRTTRWIADYYGAPIGMALRAALPSAMWGAARPDADRVTERILALSADPPSLLERERMFRRRRRQRELYEALESLGGRAPVRHVVDQLGFGDALVRALVRSGLAQVHQTERIRDPFAGTAGTTPPVSATPDQAAALQAIDALPPGHGALLFGVTGSGKTFVYLEAVRRALARGRGAIVLVPEIGLTPQTVSRLRGAFGDQVAVLHSGLSEGERADAWRLLRRGARRVAVGARSAVFAPVVDLGLIVVDEEHDASYKNNETPRYHARDVASVRARLETARLVLGSATPSLEAMALVPDRLEIIPLPARVGMRPLPPVELVDLRVAPKVTDTGPVPWSERLDEAVAGALDRGEQAILLLNRRGWASFLQCGDCGEVRRCPRCSVSLTVHQNPPTLRCHYCGHAEPIPPACPACANPLQQMRGVGTQQVERLLAERYPSARVARMDLDSTSTKWSHQRILGAVERHEVDLLVGTQMIAKGLDFPNVTLVGVVDADTGLYLPDFRSAERAFQLLAQVAGRAGRGPRGGTVLVQTRNPRHPALVRAATHDTEGFLAEELRARAWPAYPPTVALANLVTSSLDEQASARRAAEVADWCRALIDRHGLALEVLGPAPCALARIKERWRWHVMLRGEARALGRLLRYAVRRLPRSSDVRVVIDRDPTSVL
ncbi:MAG TPA: primosomal protein N' [Gemmatimonadales bacterium]|nr:primosomal protein N' [Gemmatimonadales bacterium]